MMSPIEWIEMRVNQYINENNIFNIGSCHILTTNDHFLVVFYINKKELFKNYLDKVSEMELTLEGLIHYFYEKDAFIEHSFLFKINEDNSLSLIKDEIYLYKNNISLQ